MNPADPGASRDRGRGRARGRRWLPDDETAAPLDLRLVPAAATVWAGCLVALWAGPHTGTVVAIVGAAAALLMLTGLAARRDLRRRRWCAGTLAALICLAAAAGGTVLRTTEIRSTAAFAASETGTRGVAVVEVTSDPVRLDAGPGGTERYLIRGVLTEIATGPATLTGPVPVTVFVDGSVGSPVPGQTLSVAGRLGPDVFTSWPTVSLQATEEPAVRAAPPWWQQAGADFRSRFSAVASTTGGAAAGLLPGIVLGDRTGIPPALTQDAKITGLTHLLAVSGSHFVILCGVVLLALRRFGPRAAAVGGLLFAVALIVVVRPSPSVLRAALMGGLTLLALLAGRNRSTVPALAAAVVVLLLADPALAEDAGFALSVQATAAIVVVAPRWTAGLERRGWPPGWANLLTVPAVAQLGTMPVIAGLSGSVSVWALPANMLASFAVPVALILGAVAALLTGWWDGAASLVVQLAAPAADWIAFCAHWVAGWPYAVLPWTSEPVGVLALGVLVVGVPLALTAPRLRAAATAVVLLAVATLVPVTVISGGWPPPGWAAVGCEVGQGDGFVVATGVPGEAVVIDTGPEASVMDRCLDRLDIDRVPLVILTHLHADHIDGFEGVLDGRTVDRVGVGPGREPATAWTPVLAQAADAGVPVAELTLGTHLSIGGLGLTVLGPDRSRVSSFLGPNDQSLVVMIETGTARMLFTGDIEDDGQRALVRSGQDLRADVLKIPHHGSANLRPDFMAAVRARIVLVGVGADNDFGHPTAFALQLAERSGAVLVLRTDTGGDVAVTQVDGVLAGHSRGASVIRAHAAGRRRIRTRPGLLSRFGRTEPRRTEPAGIRVPGRRRAPPSLRPVHGRADRRVPAPAGGARPERRRRTAPPRADPAR
ncbi:ComEC/Rec2 family competence protein [Nakamurella deserti]|uniref:ComEC/Rec2 family competence protein n=1 Tax=Nakamurella deserti TaxID=2164074 RepID=UPI000DBE476E|nr:ComEC/Rec2 family competence protein [Nakamurella deserti]